MKLRINESILIFFYFHLFFFSLSAYAKPFAPPPPGTFDPFQDDVFLYSNQLDGVFPSNWKFDDPITFEMRQRAIEKLFDYMVSRNNAGFNPQLFAYLYPGKKSFRNLFNYFVGNGGIEPFFMADINENQVGNIMVRFATLFVNKMNYYSQQQGYIYLELIKYYEAHKDKLDAIKFLSIDKINEHILFSIEQFNQNFLHLYQYSGDGGITPSYNSIPNRAQEMLSILKSPGIVALSGSIPIDNPMYTMAENFYLFKAYGERANIISQLLTNLPKIEFNIDKLPDSGNFMEDINNVPGEGKNPIIIMQRFRDMVSGVLQLNSIQKVTFGIQGQASSIDTLKGKLSKSNNGLFFLMAFEKVYFSGESITGPMAIEFGEKTFQISYEEAVLLRTTMSGIVELYGSNAIGAGDGYIRKNLLYLYPCNTSVLPQ